MSVKIDEIDLNILRALEKDARKSCREIAKELNIATGTVYNRIKKLMERKILRGFVPILDYSQLGYDLTALILVQVEGGHIVEVENEIAKIKEALCVYDVTGEFDVAVLAKFKNREALNRTIKSILKIPYVKRTVTNVVLNTVKENFVISL